MATDLKVILDDVPGSLAQLGEALGNAGVNIEGIAGIITGAKCEAHILVEDAAAARSALEGAGISVEDAREVAVVDCKDAPGELGAIARKIADAGVNINLAYLATNTRLVIGSDDLEKAKSAL